MAHYVIALGKLAIGKSYILRYFATSLIEVAFQRYSELKPDSVADRADMQKKFMDHL